MYLSGHDETVPCVWDAYVIAPQENITDQSLGLFHCGSNSVKWAP